MPDAAPPVPPPAPPRLPRRARYRRVLAAAAGAPAFELDGLKAGFPQEPPATITRLVNELAAAGWLVEQPAEPEPGAQAGPGGSRTRERPARGDRKPPRRLRWNTARGPFDPDAWLDRKLAGDRIAERPAGERPRERLLDAGAASLTNAELFAILVRSGRPGESAVTAGVKLAKHHSDAGAGRLANLPEAGRAELKAVSKAVDVTAYCAILAGVELGRRVAAAAEAPPDACITGTASGVAFCRRRFARLATDGVQEEFHVVTLDTRHHVIATHRITVGTLDASLVHPREVFRPVLRDAAAAVLLVHNHPSGDPSPSPEDHAVTRRLEAAGRTLGIDVLDHVIVASSGSASLRAAG